jgi:hypothetical protein
MPAPAPPASGGEYKLFVSGMPPVEVALHAPPPLLDVVPPLEPVVVVPDVELVVVPVVLPVVVPVPLVPEFVPELVPAKPVLDPVELVPLVPLFPYPLLVPPSWLGKPCVPELDEHANTPPRTALTATKPKRDATCFFNMGRSSKRANAVRYALLVASKGRAWLKKLHAPTPDPGLQAGASRVASTLKPAYWRAPSAGVHSRR